MKRESHGRFTIVVSVVIIMLNSNLGAAPAAPSAPSATVHTEKTPAAKPVAASTADPATKVVVEEKKVAGVETTDLHKSQIGDQGNWVKKKKLLKE